MRPIFPETILNYYLAYSLIQPVVIDSAEVVSSCCQPLTNNNPQNLDINLAVTVTAVPNLTRLLYRYVIKLLYNPKWNRGTITAKFISS